MNRAVAYYNRGTSCFIRLLTSVWSLRKHFDGPVRLYAEGMIPEGIVGVLNELSVDVVALPASDEATLVVKSGLWRFLQDEHSLYLDADTIVCSPVDELFDRLVEHDHVVTRFGDWGTLHEQIERRIRGWESVVPEMIQPALDYGSAVSSGVLGWQRGNPILPEYEKLTRRGHAAGCDTVVLDEIAMQLLLPHFPHHLTDSSWNVSGQYGDVESAQIIHYHGSRHCRGDPRSDVWKRHYFELWDRYPQHSVLLSCSLGDECLEQFQRNVIDLREDLTVVTAVNPGYAAHLSANLAAWRNLPGLKNQRIMVFVNGFNSDSELEFLEPFDVEVIEWKYAWSEATTREQMLAAFVFAVADKVKTPYWMKLDADCKPVKAWWEWPDYSGSGIVSQRWTFTKIKGDEEKRHWFNRLDDVFRPDDPLFDHEISAIHGIVDHKPGNRDGLPLRFASFCHIERLAHTQRMANHLVNVNGGRLPIPSQDTTSWYCSLIWNEDVRLMEMRDWFRFY